MDIRHIKKSEWNLLAVFNATEYRPDHILTNKIYYDWQFDNYTNAKKDYYTTVGMFDNKGDLVGTCGRFMLPYAMQGETVMGNCLANLIIKKDLRNLGLGYMLLNKASALNDIAIDHTINETAWPMFMKSGWQGENLKRYVFVINPKNKLYDLPAVPIRPIPMAGLRFEQLQKFDGTIVPFWRNIRHRYPITIERTQEYLNWRYAGNPLTSYKQFVVRRGSDIKAFLILRIEEVRRDKPMNVRIGRIIDVASDETAEHIIFFKTQEFCRMNNVDVIDYFTSGLFHHAALLDRGFIDGDISPYSSLPLLFNPVSTKRTHLNFAVRKNPQTLLSDWYTTKGGGDQDRPY